MLLNDRIDDWCIAIHEGTFDNYCDVLQRHRSDQVDCGTFSNIYNVEESWVTHTGLPNVQWTWTTSTSTSRQSSLLTTSKDLVEMGKKVASLCGRSGTIKTISFTQECHFLKTQSHTDWYRKIVWGSSWCYSEFILFDSLELWLYTQ